MRLSLVGWVGGWVGGWKGVIPLVDSWLVALVAEMECVEPEVFHMGRSMVVSECEDNEKGGRKRIDFLVVAWRETEKLDVAKCANKKCKREDCGEGGRQGRRIG
jgi:hypothetical protein